MDNPALLIIDSLEKLNLMLCSPIISQENIEKGKKIAAMLEDDIEQLFKDIDILESLSSDNGRLDFEQLTKIIDDLSCIIRKLNRIDRLRVIAAQAHVITSESEGYVDNE